MATALELLNVLLLEIVGIAESPQLLEGVLKGPPRRVGMWVWSQAKEI